MQDQKLLRFLELNTPCYVYDKAVIAAHAEALLKALPGFSVLASVKTNPFLPVMRTLAEFGIGADAASAREVAIAIEAGMPKEDVYYSAAGKSNADINNSLGACVLTADSAGEIERIDALSENAGVVSEIGVRVNPNFTMESDTGVSSKFGVCEEELIALSKRLETLKNVRVTGIHVHVKSQILDADKLGSYYEKVFAMAKRIDALPNFSIRFVNFGGGVGTVYDASCERPLDFAKLKKHAEAVVKDNENTLRARLIVESGRYLSCDAGTYYTRVVDIKESRGKKYVIVQNGLNGFLRPVMTHTLNTLLPNQTFPVPEPLYTREHAFEFDVLTDETELDAYDLVGNLCTAADVLLGNAHMKKARIGDVVSVSKAGSYAFGLTPVNFSSHPVPGEFLRTEDGFVSE